MLNRFLGRVHQTSHGAPLLRGYLWWGLIVRAALLLALLTVLGMGRNVLAEWVLTSRLPFVSPGDIDELTVISYGLLFLFLSVGTGARWRLLRRLEALETPADAE
jgi:hypothetical protein